jgi:hypothetical protein
MKKVKIAESKLAVKKEIISSFTRPAGNSGNVKQFHTTITSSSICMMVEV